MLWFAGQVLVIAVCLAAALVVGRAVVGLAGRSDLCSGSSEGAATYALTATAIWTLAFGWCSYAGLPARTAALAVLLGSVAVLALCAHRHGVRSVLPPATGRQGAALIGLGLAAGVLSLLPLALGNTFHAMNDTIIRIVISDFLQEHGFYAPVGDTRFQPALGIVAQYQQGAFRMGATFFLALVQALAPGLQAIDVYPAVSAWAVALNVWSFFLLARWGLGVAPRYAAVGAAMLAVLPNPMHSAAAGGFLPQTFGTAALAFNLALLSRLLRRLDQPRAEAALPGLSYAFLVSVYNELMPVAILAFGVATAFALARARPTARVRLVRALGLAIGIGLVLANVEVVRALRAVRSQLSVTVGFHVRWSPLDFLSFAGGVRPGGTAPETLLPGWALGLLTLAVGVFVVIGLARTLRRGDAAPSLAALAVFGLLAAYFAVVVRDPWTGAVGHTWSLYKVAQWAFPLLLAFQCVGLEWLTRSRKLALLPVGIAGLAIVFGLPAQVALARERVELMQDRADSSEPFEAYRRLAAAVDAREPDLVYLVDRHGASWPRVLLTYFLHPRPVASDWRSTSYLSSSRTTNRDVAEARPQRPISLLVGRPPYACYELLPGGVSLVPNGPLVAELQAPGRTDTGSMKPFFWIGDEKATLHVWSPREASVALAMRLRPGPDGPRGSAKRLVVETAAGYRADVPIGDRDTLTIELPMEAGANVVSLSSPEAMPADQRRGRQPQRYLGIEEVQVVFAGEPAPGEGCPG